MDFTGRFHFNFDSYDVWRVYNILLRASQEPSVTVDVEWLAFTNEDLDPESPTIRALANCEAVRAEFPGRHGKFVEAMLTLAYQERDRPGAHETLAVAAHVAGVDLADLNSSSETSGLKLLEQTIAAARERGVSAVPTIERQGPPLHIKTTGAANFGNATDRLHLIDSMLRDDGIWELTKPD
ncbi:MAG: hypothetical protein QNJ77_11485 [Acidimicrobiia bacterium]|nr:hypothetical protein [Acidimicrobiia bacterium]